MLEVNDLIGTEHVGRYDITVANIMYNFRTSLSTTGSTKVLKGRS